MNGLSQNVWKGIISPIELLDAMGDLLYVRDVQTYELLFINTSAQESMPLIDGYIGQKCYEALQGRKTPCDCCPIQNLSAHTFYEWEHSNEINGCHYLRKDRLLDWDGRKTHMGIAFDMTARVHGHEALSRTLEGERVLLECVQMLYDVEMNLEDALQGVLKKLGTFLCAERSFLFLIQGDQLDNQYEWCAPGVIPQMRNLQGLDICLIDRWREEFQRQNCVIIMDVDRIREISPDEYSVLHEQGITSLAVVPLMLEKQLVGFIGVDNPPPGTLQNIIQQLQTLQYFLMIAFTRAEERKLLLQVSFHDELTGLYNRNRYIRDIKNMQAVESSVGIVYLDVNGMKEYNDRYGHEHGDSVLVNCAQLIRSCFTQANCYRIGGDEFVVFWNGCEQKTFERQLLYLRRELTFNENFDVAVGSQWMEKGGDLSRMIDLADQKMYVDKKRYYRTGKFMGRYRHDLDDVMLITDPNVLEQLLEKRCFLIYLQPKISFVDRTLIGAEALVRLDLNGELQPPDSFISRLEETGQIARVDFYVFATVCDLLARWKRQQKPLTSIAVNFSRYSLLEPDFLSRLVQICAEHDVERSWLEIEITESVEGFPGFDLNQFMKQIRSAGFRVSLDDFGAHYSNVSMLAFSKFDVLKFDKSLITDINDNKQLQMMLLSIVHYSDQLGVQTVAEGVETEAQFETLRRLGVKQAQGYLFNRPIPVREYEELYLNESGTASMTALRSVNGH